MKVLDSDDTELATLCGNVIPKPLKSQSNKMTVKFYSDESENKPGFQAKWKGIENPTSGEFKSPNYPENYNNRERVSQILEAPKGSRIEINIVDFETEWCCDRLSVFYGAKRPKVGYRIDFKKSIYGERFLFERKERKLNKIGLSCELCQAQCKLFLNQLT